MKLIQDIHNANTLQDQLYILANMGRYRASRPFTINEVKDVYKFFRDVEANWDGGIVEIMRGGTFIQSMQPMLNVLQSVPHKIRKAIGKLFKPINYREQLKHMMNMYVYQIRRSNTRHNKLVDNHYANTSKSPSNLIDKEQAIYMKLKHDYNDIQQAVQQMIQEYQVNPTLSKDEINRQIQQLQTNILPVNKKLILPQHNDVNTLDLAEKYKIHTFNLIKLVKLQQLQQLLPKVKYNKIKSLFRYRKSNNKLPTPSLAQPIVQSSEPITIYNMGNMNKNIEDLPNLPQHPPQHPQTQHPPQHPYNNAPNENIFG